MEKKIEFKNYIGIYDGYITKQVCDDMITLFENKKKFNKTLTRIQSENTASLYKDDETLFLNESNIEDWFPSQKLIFFNFDIALKNYLEHTNINQLYSGSTLDYTVFRVQKTTPGKGYHIWHVEHSLESSNRVLAFTIYLNDMDEGGETEFLHQSVRVSPKTGRIVIWPAGFPYVHRGNPPLKDEKYILTSWIVCKK
jgi:hypothetical protein